MLRPMATWSDWRNAMGNDRIRFIVTPVACILAASCGGVVEPADRHDAGEPGRCGALESLAVLPSASICVSRSVAIPLGYSIDATEVTRSQYEAWLSTGPDPSVQPQVCKWNSSFVPNPSSKLDPYVCHGNACEDHPQTFVDWCDAHAFCESFGKRLCGAIEGAAVSYDDLTFMAKGQWVGACTSGGIHNYPYGGSSTAEWDDGFDPRRCNGYDNWATGCKTGSCMTVPAGSLGDCQSTQTGFGGVYDLSGNVGEWEDSCDGFTGGQDFCHVRGGSFFSDRDSLRCVAGAYASERRADANDVTGFRCCSLQ